MRPGRASRHASITHARRARIRAIYETRAARGKHSAVPAASHPGKRLRKARSTSPRPDWPGPLLPEPRLTWRRTLEASEKSEQKAAKGIDLSETGYDQIHELELLVKVKEQSVEHVRDGLDSAEHDLAYTQVKRRSLGSSLNATGTWATSHRLRLPF